ncbi:MAG: amino acid permease [Phycisphaerales bacterium]
MPELPPSPPRDLPRALGVLPALGVMIGIIIGSGIFKTPSEIAGATQSPLVVLLCWLAGGVISLFGAFTYAELATMFPQSGGVYVFLREGYGRGMAFVFGWTYMLVSKPAAAAGIAVIFTENLHPLLGITWDARYTTIALIVVLTFINARGVSLGAGVATVLTALKVLALLAIVALALALRKGSAGNFHAAPSLQPLHLVLVGIMSGVLWTYDGWSDVGAIAGEIKQPDRKLPFIYMGGTIFITGLYLAVNAVYIWMMPLSEMARQGNVAPAILTTLVGAAGGTAVMIIVVVSTLGSTLGSILTGARVTYAQSRDGLLFAFLSRVHPRFGTPAVALWCQCALSCAAVWFLESFGRMAGSFVFTMWIFYGLAGATIFVMRVKRPDMPRAYRCLGYPLVPALFVASSVMMTVLSIMADWKTCLTWVGVLLAGIPVYLVWSRMTGKETERPSRADTK